MQRPSTAGTSQCTGPGGMLAAVRSARRLSVDEVAERLKFAPRQIAALEADDFERLPGATFVRGMIRSYAKLLDVDPGPVLAAYEQVCRPEPVSVDLNHAGIPFRDPRARSNRLYRIMSAVIVVAVAAVLYEWQFGLPGFLLPSPAPRVEVTRVAAAPQLPVRDAPAELSGTDVRNPVEGTEGQAQDAAVEPPPPGKDRLSFEFRDESWVEVKDRHGKTLMSQLNPGGTRQTIEGEAPFSLVIGNAAMVTLVHNERPVDLGPYIKVNVARMVVE